jgi:ABC-2 type transport system permease protein
VLTTALGRLRHQVRYDLLVLVRNREARYFTFALPVLMLVLFVSIFGHQPFELDGVAVPGATYYVATQLVFGIVDGAMMTTAVAIVGFREVGILKRRRATPQPAWVVVVSRGVVGVLSALALSGLLLAVSAVAYGTRVPLGAVPMLVVAVMTGAFSFCALGFAVSTMIRNAESATPVVMGVTLPLFFVSGVFVPWFLIPPSLRFAAELFPVRHLASLTTHAVTGTGAGVVDLVVIAAWGAAATVVAARRFRWSPRAV